MIEGDRSAAPVALSLLSSASTTHDHTLLSWIKGTAVTGKTEELKNATRYGKLFEAKQLYTYTCIIVNAQIGQEFIWIWDQADDFELNTP
jgi:hypothetical protein